MSSNILLFLCIYNDMVLNKYVKFLGNEYGNCLCKFTLPIIKGNDKLQASFINKIYINLSKNLSELRVKDLL